MQQQGSVLPPHPHSLWLARRMAGGGFAHEAAPPPETVEQAVDHAEVALQRMPIVPAVPAAVAATEDDDVEYVPVAGPLRQNDAEDPRPVVAVPRDGRQPASVNEGVCGWCGRRWGRVRPALCPFCHHRTVVTQIIPAAPDEDEEAEPLSWAEPHPPHH